MLYQQTPMMRFTQKELPERIQMIAPILARDSKPLDKKWQGIMDAHDKFIIFSPGTITHPNSDNHADYQRVFDVLGEYTDYQIIMKNIPTYKLPEFKFPDNFQIHDWIPQNDLFGHDEKIKLFISHSGFNSLAEATYHQIPVACVPDFADQIMNA
eukprot:UN27673